jgi:hypothetical protein
MGLPMRRGWVYVGHTTHLAGINSQIFGETGEDLVNTRLKERDFRFKLFIINKLRQILGALRGAFAVIKGAFGRFYFRNLCFTSLSSFLKSSIAKT